MITGGKVGQILGRKRAFAIGCVIYGCGSFITALAPNLAVLMLGWSVLEGIGAALIMPAIVALVASNFAPRRAAAGLRAGRLGRRHRRRRRPAHRRPLHHLRSRGGWVFAGEVLVVLVILALTRRMADTPAEDGRAARPRRHRALGARASAWSSSASCARARGGSCSPKPGAPEWLGLSPVDLADPRRRRRALRLPALGAAAASTAAQAALLDPAMLRNRLLRGGLTVVLLPVPAAGGPVLRRAAVPVGRARAVGHRHRRAAAAAVDHAAARRGRHAQGASRTPRPAGSCGSGSSPSSPASSC